MVDREAPLTTTALAKVASAEGLLATPAPVDIVSTTLLEVVYRSLLTVLQSQSPRS